MKSIKIWMLLPLALLLATACGNSQQQHTVSLDQASSDVAAIYNSTCIRCHATDLSGKMGDRTNLQQVYERLTYDEIVQAITKGVDTMPSFEDQLTTEEIANLAAWLSKQ